MVETNGLFESYGYCEIVNTKETESGYSPFEFLFGISKTFPIIKEDVISELSLQKRFDKLAQLISLRVYLIKQKKLVCE